MNVGVNVKCVGSRKVVRERDYLEQFRVREQETGRRVSRMINTIDNSSQL